MADRVALGLFVLGSEVDAEREGLRVEAEAADRAAGEQFKRPGAPAGARAVGRSGLEVPAGGNSRENRSKVGSVMCKSLKSVGGIGRDSTLDPGIMRPVAGST